MDPCKFQMLFVNSNHNGILANLYLDNEQQLEMKFA